MSAVAADNAAVSLRNLRFSYPSAATETLHIDEFTLDRGSSLFLHGPSGSGKTTLLELLAGVLTPSSGSIKLLGKDVGALSGPERDRFRADHIGYIFQSFNLIPYLNVRENVRLPLHLSSERSRKCTDPDAETTRLLQVLGLADFLERRVTELSVGQQQRVAAARALIGAPEIILADEPTSALDADQRTAFLKLLFDLAKPAGTTVLFVSHDRSLENLFDRRVSLAELQGRPA